jgi:hypothetical protein
MATFAYVTILTKETLCLFQKLGRNKPISGICKPTPPEISNMRVEIQKYIV